MTITNGYCSLGDLKDRLGITDTDDNTQLESVIEGVSRWIDKTTGRRFYDSTGARYYTARWGDWLLIDDIAIASSAFAITSLKTDDDDDGTYETTWATTDYYFEPRNGVIDDKPAQAIHITRNGDYAFPVGVWNGVEVTATFGYTTDGNAPDMIREACILGAMRWWKRRDAIYGVAGAPALGVQIVQAKITADADLMMMLEPFKRRTPLSL